MAPEHAMWQERQRGRDTVAGHASDAAVPAFARPPPNPSLGDPWLLDPSPAPVAADEDVPSGIERRVRWWGRMRIAHGNALGVPADLSEPARTVSAPAVCAG